MKRIGIAVGVILLLGTGLATGADFDLQGRINGAASGELVEVPAGMYYGNFILKEGVILVGEGADSTILNARGSGPVLIGAEGCIVKGFTITNGLEGIKAGRNLMGIFGNVIRDNAGSGICSGGGCCVIANNLLYNNGGKGGLEISRSYVLAVGNTIVGQNVGLSFWQSPWGIVTNNIIAYNEVGIKLEDSLPDIENNDFWANGRDIVGGNFKDDNMFLDPLFSQMEAGDFSLLPQSPLLAAGIEIEGLPEELTSDLGAKFGILIPLDNCREMMDRVRALQLQWKPLVRYELLEGENCFRVTTRFPYPDFTINSSSRDTAIEDIVSFDSESRDDLLSEFIDREPPAVKVQGWDGENYPYEKDRYVMDSVFCKPESYFTDSQGLIHFIRKTNFSRIQIAIPEGYVVEKLNPTGEIDEESGRVLLRNPRQELIQIDLVLSP